MGAIKDSIKIIEISEEEIDALKPLVDGVDLSEEDKATLIYGLNLIVWLPKLLLEQNTTIFRLKELLFGKSQSSPRPKNKQSLLMSQVVAKNRKSNLPTMLQSLIVNKVRRLLIRLMTRCHHHQVEMDELITLSMMLLTITFHMTI